MLVFVSIVSISSKRSSIGIRSCSSCSSIDNSTSNQCRLILCLIILRREYMVHNNNISTIIITLIIINLDDSNAVDGDGQHQIMKKRPLEGNAYSRLSITITNAYY